MADQPEQRVTFNDQGQKIVESDPIGGTDLYSRVDIYESGQGTPDGPGHDHYWFNQNKSGEQDNMGAVFGNDRDDK